ncbi:MAG: hypothetical protein EOP48_12800 [Sphingobacteriales bacterium]|nr:MAG: hypothetical protein EOP48_12800 [Sphingobacteriales bacterium]
MPHFPSPPQPPLLPDLDNFENHIGYFPDELYLNGFVIVQKDGLFGIYREFHRFKREDNHQFKEYLPVEFAHIDFFFSSQGIEPNQDVYFILTNSKGKKAIDKPSSFYRTKFIYDDLAGDGAKMAAFRNGANYGILDLREYWAEEFNFQPGLEIDINQVEPFAFSLLEVADKQGQSALFSKDLKQVTKFCFTNNLSVDKFGNYLVYEDSEKRKYKKYSVNEFFKEFGP